MWRLILNAGIHTPRAPPQREKEMDVNDPLSSGRCQALRPDQYLVGLLLVRAPETSELVSYRIIILISRRLASYPIPGEYLEHYTHGNIRADHGPCRWSLDSYQ